MATDLLFVMAYEYGIGICGLLLLIPLVKKLRKRKSAVTRDLVLCIFFLLVAILISGTSRILRITNAWEVSPGTFLELLAFAVVSIAISNIFMLAFTLEVFYEGAFRAKNKGYMLAYIGLVAGYSAYALNSGLYSVDLTQEIWLFLILLSVVIYVFLIRSAFRLARRLEDPIMKRGMQLIGLGPVFLLMFFGCGMVDRILGGNFTPFYFVGMSLALGFIFITYLGFIQPEWFKRQVKQSRKKPSKSLTSSRKK